MRPSAVFVYIRLSMMKSAIVSNAVLASEFSKEARDTLPSSI